jgi:hypothetical protein
MTYQDDPNLKTRRSYRMTEDKSSTGWIVGGLVALVVIIGIFFLFGRPDTNTASVTNVPGTSAPTTTGSATPAPPRNNAPATSR